MELDKENIIEVTRTDKSSVNRNWIIFVITLLLLFGVREWFNQKRQDTLISDIVNYSDSARFERLKNGALISVNSTLELNSEKQIRDLASKWSDTMERLVNEFKSIDGATYITNKFYAGKDTIKYETQIPCDFSPFKVRRGTSKTYQLVGTIGKDYFSVDSLAIHDSVGLVFGRKKVGFMKYDNVVAINHTNPLMISTNITDLKYKPEKKWYERTWVHALGGALIYQGIRTGGQALINNIRR